MARDFYPFVEQGAQGIDDQDSHVLDQAVCSARIAVYDDAAAAPRVVVVDPKETRSYLEEITATVTKLSHDQGGAIPFMVIREVVENLIHAYFREPAISILDGGNTIRFADQGPGILEKDRALEYGTTSATEEMKRYIRGVGSGLPYVQQYLKDKGGDLVIQDNILAGTIVTITLPMAHATTTAQATLTQGAFPQTAAAMMPPVATQATQVALQGQVPQQVPQQVYQQVPQPIGQQAYQHLSQVVGQQAYQQVPYQAYEQLPQQAAWQHPQQSMAGQGVQMVPEAAAQQAQAPYPMGQAHGGQAPIEGTPPVQGTGTPEVKISERGRMALDYLSRHESVGPTELVSAYGLSQSTWTRELKALEDAGAVSKRGGQKRFLTQFGRTLIG